MAETLALAIGDFSVRQFDGLFSLNDLHKASGGEENYKPAFFLRNDQTQALVAEIGKGADLHLFLNTIKGRNGGTYACRELVIAYAAWINPAFHLKVIRVFLNATAPEIQNDRISPAQKQHIKELVDLIVASGKQDYPGTWARFQRKMGCNKYELLHPSKFDAAVAYLQGKLDDQSIATLIQKHLPGAVPKALPAPSPKTDMDTASLAFALAVEAAARIQRAVFDAVMATGKPPGEARIMAGLTFDKYNGVPIEPWVYFVKPEEMLTSFERLAKDIADPGLLVSNAELINLASACNNRLAQRMSKQSKPSKGVLL